MTKCHYTLGALPPDHASVRVGLLRAGRAQVSRRIEQQLSNPPVARLTKFFSWLSYRLLKEGNYLTRIDSKKGRNASPFFGAYGIYARNS